ncbi:Pirin domain protein [Hyaloraphidium curvatum]|nr:Pirin domain protein [Hyaloraphidium curvatum]
MRFGGLPRASIRAFANAGYKSSQRLGATPLFATLCLLPTLASFATTSTAIESQPGTKMSKLFIGKERPLGFQWQTENPFIFTVHHADIYPPDTTGLQAPDPALLKGRNMGNDFEIKDGWRMYHGDVVPGFPQHPHRGFETITIVREGFIDHSDSLGGAARFGGGSDTQWMTAGRGIVHCEMFPLISKTDNNPTNFFQIWIRLPKVDRMVDPSYAMLWAEKIPKKVLKDENGNETEVIVIANGMNPKMPWGEEVPTFPHPPPNSWASRPDAHVWIWTIKLKPNAKFTLPAAAPGLNRNLYFHMGKTLKVSSGPDPVTAVDSREFRKGVAIKVRSDADAYIENGPEESEILLLQGKPIEEPIVQHGPFVGNTQNDIVAAFQDYQRTMFGGWPYISDEPVHDRDIGRFARHPDGKLERPGADGPVAKIEGIAPRRDEL